MKKYFVFILALMLLLAGCASEPAASPAGTAAPEATKEAVAPVEEAAPALTVYPLPCTIDMAALDNCTVHVSLNEGDAYLDDNGIMQMKVTVYDYELYDMVDISMLKEGDSIVALGQTLEISSIERGDNSVLINGGLEAGGLDLYSEGNTVFYVRGYNDSKSWYPLGEATIRVSTDFEFTDSSDLDAEPVVYYPGDFLIEESPIMYHFVPSNTSIVIQHGQIIAMDRVYIP